MPMVRGRPSGLLSQAFSNCPFSRQIFNFGHCLGPAAFLSPLPGCIRLGKDIVMGKISILERIIHAKAKYAFSQLADTLNFATTSLH